MISTLAYYQGIPFDNPIVNFYAICIIAGACLALFLSNYHAHQDGYDMSFFNSVFFVAFPSGIIGARIWYVIASWDEFAGQAWWKVFAIWEGGLAIQGGIIGGVLLGVIYCLLRRQGTSILKIMDFAVPTIIVAQAIGRWGNFFNQEVYGHAVLPEAWNFLPGFITQNMQNGTSRMIGGGYLPEGSIAVPLFLVEGMVNLMFYFLIRYGVKAVLGKKYKNGDMSFFYFTAYGIIRFILEPLRNPQFIMGTTTIGDTANYRSYWMALAFIIGGILLMVINHILAHLAEIGKFDHFRILREAYLEDNFKVLEVKDASRATDVSSIDMESLKNVSFEEEDNVK